MAYVQQIQEVPKSVGQWMAFVGLESPFKRAVLAASITGLAVYLAKPALFFTESGVMRQQHIPYLHAEKLPEDPVDDSTQVHFLMIPASAAILAGVLI